jgi:chromosome segregation ATPase
MSDPEEELTPTLAEAQRRRVDIHSALVDVEEATSSPAIGREEEWTRDVVDRLTKLRETIEEHIEVTERAEGLYDEILEKAPRLADKVDRLKHEHPEMRDGISEISAKLRTNPVGTTWSLQEARDELRLILGRVVRHRELGADLVWEAYNLDIGGVD